MMGFAELPKKEQAKLNLWLEYTVEGADYFDSFKEFLEDELDFQRNDLGHDDEDFDVQVALEALAEWQED